MQRYWEKERDLREVAPRASCWAEIALFILWLPRSPTSGAAQTENKIKADSYGPYSSLGDAGVRVCLKPNCCCKVGSWLVDSFDVIQGNTFWTLITQVMWNDALWSAVKPITLKGLSTLFSFIFLSFLTLSALPLSFYVHMSEATPFIRGLWQYTWKRCPPLPPHIIVLHW